VSKYDLADRAVGRTVHNPALPHEDQPAAARARLLLVIEQEAAAESFAGWLRNQERVTMFVAQSSTRAMMLAHDLQPEIAVVDLLFRDSSGIALGIELQRQAPHVEVVFSVPHLGSPEALAARDLGITRLVATAQLTEWLERSLDPLIEVARARRRLAAAERALARQPASEQAPAVQQLPLPVAEHRFREAYLRACMARAHGRREAAKLAGVPYTSLCVMLRKLGITLPD
jgi:DNA-binding NtrC family response regulator